MKKWLRYPLYLLLLSLAGAALGDFCQKQTKGFRLQNLLSSYPPLYPCTPVTETEKESICKILAQPFYFLKKGQQCFAFASQDGKYVLKLFRWDKLEPSPFMRYLPLSFTQKNKEEKSKKQSLDFASYQIAYTHLKEETGLVFLTLAPQKDLNVPIELYDNLYIKHILLANDIAFILQKKVEDFFPKFIATKQIDSLHPFLLCLANILHKRADQKISDSDITLEYNMGILDGKPVLFDIGNLRYLETTALKEAKFVLTALAKKDPSLSLWLEEKLDK